MEKNIIRLFLILGIGGLFAVGCELSSDSQPDIVEYDYDDISGGVGDDHSLDSPDGANSDVMTDLEVLSLEDVCLPFAGKWKCFYEKDGLYYGTRIITLLRADSDVLFFTIEPLEQGGVYRASCNLDVMGLFETYTTCKIAADNSSQMNCVVIGLWDPNESWAYKCDKL
jgi:hypothetical protein